MGLGNLLVFHRHLWIQRYKKRDPFCYSNRSGKCYSSSSRPMYATSKVMIKGSGLERDVTLRAIRQADTIGSAMRRPLLGELEGTCITCAKSEKIPQEYSTIVGNLYGPRNAFICAKGLRYVTAQDIILPPSVEIVDNTQHITSLTEPIYLCIGLQIERNRVYDIEMRKNFQDRSYPIDVVFMLVRNANHCINCYGNDNEKQEMLFLEIWKNGSLTLKEALRE
ncbi:hypothetical protein Gotur_023533, partial [Gossypium turneri]